MSFIRGINHVTLAVSDLEKSFSFYHDILKLKPVCKWPKGAYFLAGDLWFCLSQDDNRKSEGSPCYTHFAFTIQQQDFDNIVKHLSAHNVPIWKENISEGDSLYIQDPDGHKLELHVGSLQSRLDQKNETPWPDTTFYAL